MKQQWQQLWVAGSTSKDTCAKSKALTWRAEMSQLGEDAPKQFEFDDINRGAFKAASMKTKGKRAAEQCNF